MKKVLIALTVLCAFVLGVAGNSHAQPPSGSVPAIIVDHGGNYGRVTSGNINTTVADAEGDHANVTSSGGLVVVGVEYAHHEIHEGVHYTSSRNATLASGAKMLLLFNTPALPTRVHMLVEFRSSGEMNMRIWNGVTVSSVGTAMEESNRDMASANIAGVIVTHTPTITDIGDEEEGFARHIGAGQTVGGEEMASNEILLPPSSLVLINGTSEAANNDVTGVADWYEDTGDAP